jgi:hypothetical protein
MANDSVVHIGENSPEEVAYRLFNLIEIREGTKAQKRKEIIDLYAECVMAVREPRLRLPGTGKTSAHFG